MNTDRKKFIDSLKVNKLRNLKNKPAVMKGRRFISKTIGKVKELSEKAKQMGGKLVRNTGRAVVIGAAVASIALGATGCTNNIEPPSSQPSYSTSSNQEWKNKDTDKLVEEVKKDFLNKYLEKYNKQNEEEYNISNLKVRVHSTGGLYEIDGKLVTIGNAAQTRAELAKIGKFEHEGRYNTLIQITNELEDGNTDILGTYTPEGKFVYSSHELEKLKDSNYTPIELDEGEIEAINVIRSSVQEAEKETEKRAEKYLENVYEEDENVK